MPHRAVAPLASRPERNCASLEPLKEGNGQSTARRKTNIIGHPVRISPSVTPVDLNAGVQPGVPSVQFDWRR